VKKGTFLLTLLLLLGLSAGAQTGPAMPSATGWSMDLGYKTGRIFKHTAKIKPAIVFPSSTVELFLARQTTGSKVWQTRYHFPRLGLLIQGTRFGNDTIFGHALAFIPSAELNVAFHSRFRIKWRMGAGLAWIDKPFNYLSNPRNNVIGSHLNNCTSFSLSFQYMLTRQFTLCVGGSFTHWSSGAVKVPNLGINVPSLDVRLRYEPLRFKDSPIRGMTYQPVRKHILFSPSLELGFRQRYPAGGAVYHVYKFSCMTGFYLSHWNKLWLGADINFGTDWYTFEKAQEIHPGQNFIYATYGSVYLQDEQEMGPVSVFEQMGAFSDYPLNRLTGLYQHIGLKYTCWRFGKEKTHKLRALLALHTHWFSAEYVALGLCTEI